MSLKAFDLTESTAIVVYLHSPKEKVWGLLLSIGPAGVIVRGLDLAAFDDWMRQEARGDDPLIGPATVFYPMNRVVRIERDETVGLLISYADRFVRTVGRTVAEALLGGRESEG